MKTVNNDEKDKSGKFQQKRGKMKKEKLLFQNTQIENVFGNSTWERFHTRICKNILGVHRRASNLASLAELGRYPITIEIKKRMVRYFLRFRGMNKNRLVYKAFEEQLKDETNPNNWVKKVEEILNGSGFSFIFNEATELNNDTAIKGIKQSSNKIQNRERDIFEQMLFSHLEEKKVKNEGKLVFYASIKKKFGQENYLRIKNLKSRNRIRDMRISTHKLHIETGRYSNLEKKQRLCSFCKKGKVESEKHFIIECKNYDNERTEFLGLLGDEERDRKGDNIIKRLFQNNNQAGLNKFGNFLDKCWEKRTVTQVMHELLNGVEKNLQPK